MSNAVSADSRSRPPWRALARAWAWPLALMAAISVASGGNPMPLPGNWLSHDKLNHLLVFGLLATAVFRAAPRPWAEAPRAILAIAVTAAFGLGDELHQSFTPGRFMELDDWIADVLGAVIAVYVYRAWPAYRRALEWHVFTLSHKASAVSCDHEPAAG